MKSDDEIPIKSNDPIDECPDRYSFRDMGSGLI